MRKYINSIIIVFLVLILSGCGDENQDQVDNTNTPTVAESQDNVDSVNNTNANNQVTILWWNLFEPIENIQPLIDNYESLHPNIDIQYEQKGLSRGVDGYITDLDYALTDGDELTTPDIFTIHNTWAGRYNLYISKSSNITDDDLNDFYPVIKADFVRNGVAAIPLYMDALAVIYNVDKTAPVTKPAGDWTTFENEARNISNNETLGFSASIANNTEFYFDVINLLFLQNGAQMTDTTGLNATFASSGSDASDALNFYYGFVGGSTPTWNKDQKKDIAEFLEGDLAMYIAPSWRLADILKYNNDYDLGLDVKVSAIPQLGGDDKVYWATYWGQTVAKDSRFKTESWTFLEYLVEEEQLKTLNKQVLSNRPLGIIYPRLSMQQELLNDPYLSPYVVAVNNAQTWYMGDGIRMKQTFIDASTNQTTLIDLESEATNILTNPGLPQ